jgi:carbonic anhydrase
MNLYKRLLLENKAWASEKLETDPSFFERQAISQSPNFFWIGCSDSRVPADEITNTEPGEIFVHRNVANLVVNTDLNMLSTLQYAVKVLNVKHIIVCGHYGCGGVRTALTSQSVGLLNKWIRNIRDVHFYHKEELNKIQDPDLRLRRLVELNVIEQVNNLARTSFIQEQWAQQKGPTVHGWVYGLDDGLLKELVMMDETSEVDPIYRFLF